MKTYFKQFTYAYTILNIVLWLMALALFNQSNVLNIRAMIFGPLFIGLLYTASMFVFKGKTIKNPFFNVLFGYLILFPIPFFLRSMYRPMWFSRPFAIYILGLIVALIYAAVVLYASIRNHQDVKALNKLIETEEQKTDV